MGREIAEGLRVAWRIPVLRALAKRSACAAFFIGFFGSLYFLFAVRTLGIGPAPVGLIVAIGGGTSLLGAAATGWLIRRFGFGRTLIGAALTTGVSSLLPPLAHGTVLVCAAYLAVAQLGDAAWSVYSIGETSLRQALVPDRLQGRVNSAMHLTFRGILPLGSLAGGALAGPFGVRNTLLAGAAGTLLSTLWLVFSPVRHLRGLPHSPVLPDSPATSAAILNR
jgi:predicted MFS family arabinose efflux permease